MSRDLTLHGLHRTIQIAFGWEDDHLHAFKPHGRRFGTGWTGQWHHVVDDDGTSLREVTLAGLSLWLRRKIICEYDFGDLWEHEIRVEAREEAQPGTSCPVCIGGARAGPPEDIGGPDGYDRLLRRLEEVRLDWLYGVFPPSPEDDALSPSYRRSAASARCLPQPGLRALHKHVALKHLALPAPHGLWCSLWSKLSISSRDKPRRHATIALVIFLGGTRLVWKERAWISLTPT